MTAESFYTADFDIGGTFTDGFFTNGISAHRAKVFTTPHDLTEGFIGCLSLGAEAFGESLNAFLGSTHVVRLSTTLGTNTLLQRRGPKVGLIVTNGGENSLYGPGSEAPAYGSILDRRLVTGIREEVDDLGRSVSEPSGAEVLQAVRELLEMGARIIAVSLRNSWRNPAHERKVRDFIAERYPVHYLRSVPLQLAHEITSSDDDHARTNTVILNAYLHRDLSRGLYKAEDLARKSGMRSPLLIVHAAGGSARVAKTVAVQTLSSGPAVAVRGAATMARLLELDNVVCADMGGTSLDVAIIGSAESPIVGSPTIGGIRIAVPVIATESIGAGGGSIARVAGDRLQVGPDSAGSVPGPVCYGKGGMNPTVTDANLILGLLDAEDFLGGRMRLDLEKARQAVERRIAQPLGIDAESAAAMIRTEVNASMAREIRERIDDSGVEAGEFAFFAFGGGGPLHACDIAEHVGIAKVVGFPFGSVFSAFGSSTVDVWHRYSRSLVLGLADPEAKPRLKQTVDALLSQGRLDMRGEGFSPNAVTESFNFVLETQSGRAMVPFATAEELLSVHDSALRNNSDGEIREVVLDVRAEMPTWLPTGKAAVERDLRGSRIRKVRWSLEGEAIPTQVLKLEELDHGSRVSGPALIEASDTVYAVKDGWSAKIDGFGNVVMEFLGIVGGLSHDT